jgi:hypothetical protein
MDRPLPAGNQGHFGFVADIHYFINAGRIATTMM